MKDSTIKKKYIGMFITVSFKYTDETVKYSGLLIDYNDDWTYIKCTDGDYLVDGFVILKSNYIEQYEVGEWQKFAGKILALKGVTIKPEYKLPIDNLEVILSSLSKRFGCFGFQQQTNKSYWLGKIKRISEQELKLDYLTPRSKWTGVRIFKLANIRMVEFGSDYINSLMLVANSEKRGKAKKVMA